MWCPWKGGYISPYNGMVLYEVGKISRILGFQRMGIDRDAAGNFVVNVGLHTYADKHDACVAARAMNEDDFLTSSEKSAGLRYDVMECRIPVFSRFISGRDLSECVNYVSDRLKVIKMG